MHAHGDDPTPLNRRQLAALASGVGRELGWGLWTIRREVAAWRRRAAQIRAPELRALALRSLNGKRALTEGAARFWGVPRHRNLRLLNGLVAFQVMADFLDTFSEQDVSPRSAEPNSIMLAFVDAVDVDQPIRDYYRDYPGWDDGGYLRALVQACRSCWGDLPSYPQARGRLARQARLAGVLDLHHDPDPARRDRTMRQFALAGFGRDPTVPWFEQTAAASSALIVLALLALASEPRTTDRDFDAVIAAYTSVGTLSLLLDSFVDQLDDAESGHVSFIGYYPNVPDAVRRARELIGRSLCDAGDLRNGPRHVLLVSMMIALLLTGDRARSDALAAETRTLVAAGGSLTACLVPVLRFWRIAYRLRTG